ncbi:MAG: peptidoglycan DD-metalloendopeptidase family protein [Flavobacteriaceae bacterium]
MNFKNFSEAPLLVIDPSISLVDYLPIDISKSNSELENFDISSSIEWSNYIENYLSKKNAKVVFGGYLEVRDIYARSSYFKSQDVKNERNIHLGIDFWCLENTSVLSVLDGEIHSFKNNKNHGDYGPTIIIKHQFKETAFYSLYGHLTISSIKNLEIGQKVKRGEVIGFLGDASVNGDYAPHLHFQLIKDLQGNFGDYPGVCSLNELAFYKENCPNPNDLLKLKI